jgi:predicted amidohydrolase
MKLCLAQIQPLAGDVQANTTEHVAWIKKAAAQGAELILFPELSLTGYEPRLASKLAMTPDDVRFKQFQALSDAHQLTIGIGVPISQPGGISISIVLFQPYQSREVYSKKYLHPDEEPYFVPGRGTGAGLCTTKNIALAICHELSVPKHAENAFQSGAEIYLASVAKSAPGVQKASERLSKITRKYSMPTIMVNCTGPCDGFVGAGRSSVWNREGRLIGHLGAELPGLLMYDTNDDTCIAVESS